MKYDPRAYITLKCDRLGTGITSFSNRSSVSVIIAKKREATQHNVDNGHPCGADDLDLHPFPLAEAGSLALNSSLVLWYVIIQ